MRIALHCLLLLFMFVSVGSFANPVSTNNVNASLIADVSSVQPGEAFYVALVFDIREGWHTYWRNPGDSGQATSIDWGLEEGVTASEIEWPYPERQFMGPVANYGYHGTAYHRIKIQVSANWPVGKPIELVANAKWLVCEEECIPEKGQLKLVVDTADKSLVNTANQAIFEKLETRLPTTLAVSSAYQYTASKAPHTDLKEIRFEFESNSNYSSAENIEYFPYDWGVLQPPVDQQVVIDPNFVSISSRKGDLTFSGALQGVLVVQQSNGSTKAYEVESQHGVLNVKTGDVQQGRVLNSDYSIPDISVFSALLFALIGGIILNLMPCVFPVLSMKALSLVSHQGSGAGKHGVVYTFGILVSFALLGMALLFVKAAGQQIGWGFQLQSPFFVSGVIIVLFLLSLSLTGYLEIGTSMMGLGSGLANKSGYLGSFFTGVLAVIVATPCTAPFMGPAIGFALTQSAFVMLLVLMALGLGLALPFLLLSFFPVLTRALPKPGAWMKAFQQFLAFPMFATTAWLIWVLGQQKGINATFSMLLVLVLIAFAVWLWQTFRDSVMPWKGVIVVACLSALMTSAYFVYWHSSLVSQSQANLSTEQARNYQPFSVEKLESLKQNGDAVFVNMTAAWCITCLANEKVALSTPELKAYFSENNIHYLKGDWTNQDAEITQYLQSFGRNSVPLYVYYPSSKTSSGKSAKKQLKPVVLPQILTVDIVVDAFTSAESATSL